MAKKQISRERILESAVQLVSERGMDALNARSVAERCGCSTQPIYLCFENLQQLKSAVEQHIARCYDSYIADEIASGAYPAYKASGMGYIRFAKEQPNFFKHMFMRSRGSEGQEKAYRFHREAMRAVVYGFDAGQAERIHMHMWVYVHGIAVMFATGYLNMDWDTVSRLLTEEFLAMKSFLGGDNDSN